VRDRVAPEKQDSLACLPALLSIPGMHRRGCVMGLSIEERQESQRLFELGKKKCRKCKQVLPLDDFYDDASNNTNGKRGRCKSCMLGPGKRKQHTERNRELNAQGLKECAHCKEILALDKFSISRATRDGLYAWCKKCCAEIYRTRDERKKKREAWEKERQELETQGLKRCSKCKQILSLAEFYKGERYTGGKAAQCRRCKGSYTGYNSKRREESKRLDQEGQKRCYTCGNISPVEDFAPCQRLLLTACCKECRKKRGRIILQRRYAHVRNLPRTFTQEDWEKAKEYWRGKCAYCGKQTDELVQEHFTPVALNGGYTPSNIVPACNECNWSKGAKPPHVWITENGLPGVLAKIEEYFATLLQEG